MTDFINLSEISMRLRELIERSGMSSKDFANDTGIPASTLSQILNGKSQISVDSINKIVGCWSGRDGFDPMWFLFGEGFAKSEGAVGDTADLFDASHATSPSEAALHNALTSKIEEVAKLRAALELAKPKTIDHITVFYSDRSFETYTLSSDQRE